MTLKKAFSFTKPPTRKIKTKSGMTKTVAVKAHVNKLGVKPKRK